MNDAKTKRVFCGVMLIAVFLTSCAVTRQVSRDELMRQMREIQKGPRRISLDESDSPGRPKPKDVTVIIHGKAKSISFPLKLLREDEGTLIVDAPSGPLAISPTEIERVELRRPPPKALGVAAVTVVAAFAVGALVSLKNSLEVLGSSQ